MTKIANLADHLTRPTRGDLVDYAGRVDLIAQPKLDGVRAVWIPQYQKLFTRNGREITSCPHIVNALCQAEDISQLPLDGELYLHGAPFDAINAAVRQQSPTSLLLNFHVFDYVHTAPQIDRLRTLRILEVDPVRGVQLVPWQSVSRARDLKTIYQQYLDAGFEGMIIRHANLWYCDGAQHAVFKIKPVQDAEFCFVGLVGDTTVELKGKRRFSIPVPESALSELLLAGPGAMVTVAYQDMKGGLPRFPRFKSLRTA